MEQEARARRVLRGATILLVEKKDVTRTLWCRYLGTEVRVHEAATAAQALAFGRQVSRDLDLATVDPDLSDGSGWQVIFDLHALDTTLRFLVISALEDTSAPQPLSQELRERLLFVDKPTSAREVLVAAAYAYCCVQRERGLRHASDAPAWPPIERRPQHPLLSHRQSQAARGCMLGLTNQEIADQLGLNFVTARKHVCATLKKLRVVSRHQVGEAIDRDREGKKRD